MLNLYVLGILKTSIYQMTKYLFVYAYIYTGQKSILIYRIYTKWYYKTPYIPSNNTEYIQEIYVFIYTGIKKTHFCIIFYNFFMNIYKK